MLSALMVFMLTLLAGCGTSDKFSGTWISINPTLIQVLTITKNGNGYLTKITTYTYNGKPENLMKKDWTMNIKFEKEEGKERSGVAQDNKLVFDGTMNTEFILYKDADKTLNYKDLSYKKIDEKDVIKTVKQEIPKMRENVEANIKKGGPLGTPTYINVDDFYANTL